MDVNESLVRSYVNYEDAHALAARLEAGQRRKRSNDEQEHDTAKNELTRDERAKRRRVMVENAAFEFFQESRLSLSVTL